jgi:hypothetical protein
LPGSRIASVFATRSCCTGAFSATSMLTVPSAPSLTLKVTCPSTTSCTGTNTCTSA